MNYVVTTHYTKVIKDSIVTASTSQEAIELVQAFDLYEYPNGNYGRIESVEVHETRLMESGYITNYKIEMGLLSTKPLNYSLKIGETAHVVLPSENTFAHTDDILVKMVTFLGLTDNGMQKFEYTQQPYAKPFVMDNEEANTYLIKLVVNA